MSAAKRRIAVSALRALAVGTCAALMLAAGPLRAAPETTETKAIAAALEAKQPELAAGLARAALAAEEAQAAPDPLRIANYNRLLGDALFDSGDYAAAEPLYRRALALRLAALPENDADIGVSANDLAIVLRQQQKYAEAEPYYRQALAVRLVALGPADKRTARTAYFLGRTLDDQGRYAEAAATLATALELARQSYGESDETTISWLGDQAAMLHDAGDPAAEATYREAIAAAENNFADAADLRLASTRQGLGNLLLAADRAAEAVPLFRAALAAREAGLGADDPATLRTAEKLARALWSTDSRREAETLFQRLASSRESQYGPSAPELADMLRWVGRAQTSRGALADAELTYKRVLAIDEGTARLSPLLFGFDLLALGQLYSSQRRFAEAGPLVNRAVSILTAEEGDPVAGASARLAAATLAFETGRSDHAIAEAQLALRAMQAAKGGADRDVASALTALAGFEHQAGQLAAAADHATAGLAMLAQVAPTSRARYAAMSLLGRIRLDQGQVAAAETLHRDVLAALSAQFGPDDPELGTALSDLGAVLFASGDMAGAAAHFERAVALVDAAAAHDAATAFSARTGAVEDQSVARAGLFDRLIQTYARLAAADPAQRDELAQRSFMLAQRVAASRAANALADLAAREAAGSDALAVLVRQWQDLSGRWREADQALTRLRGTADAAPQDIARLAADADTLDQQIRQIADQLSTGFPRFAELQRPAPLDLPSVAARLGQNDVLLFFADTAPQGAAHQTFVWAITPDGAVTWQELGLADTALSAGVRKLRGALGVAGATRGPRALASSTGTDRTSRVLAAARDLHHAVLGPLDPVIAGRNLVIVPSRSLSALPFQLLLPSLPDPAAPDSFAAANWLVRNHAITMLPAVASLSAPSPAASGEKTYLAFANPLLSGRSGEDRRAFARQDCADVSIRTASARLPAAARLMRGAPRDAAAVRALPPLPETTDEVCTIASMLGAPDSSLHLGAAATETALTEASDSGTLAAARIVHFATHGLVSGDLDGLAEPALVLTPPDDAASGDGLLTASEIAQLHFDADWVILSACNTAGSDGSGEALSGLARSFFYAGARSLLVSHWPVNSAAAVALATTAVAQYAARPEAGKGAALRAAMLAEIARGGAHADPVNWAPFVVVGGG